MGPRIKSLKQYALDAPARWRSQYYRFDGWVSKSHKVVHDAMITLGDAITCADVNRIIGVEGWASPPECDGCGLLGHLTVTVGREKDYESNTCSLCKSCLRVAIEAIEASGG